MAPIARLQGVPPWRSFEITTHIDIVDAAGETRLWLPLPSPTVLPGWQRVEAVKWYPTTQKGATVDTAPGDMATLVGRWEPSAAPRSLTVTCRVSTRDRTAVLDHTTSGATLPAVARSRYLQPTRLIPTDGIVRETARTIVRGQTTPMAQARAIYEWIVEHTFRDPAVKGCGTGDIRWMLESRSLGGKCADLNALFVGLCRSVGLPARDLYGLRVGPSSRFKSLGREGDVTTAQHCRAEVFVDGRGWLAVDPADVRKVVLEERPGGTLADADAVRARTMLFGAWEMNWIAFNDRHDVALVGAQGKPLPFFMYPQAEVDGVRRDSLEPARFVYRITAQAAA